MVAPVSQRLLRARFAPVGMRGVARSLPDGGYVVAWTDRRAVRYDVDDLNDDALAEHETTRDFEILTQDLPFGYAHAVALRHRAELPVNETCLFLWGWSVRGPVVLVSEGYTVPCFASGGRWTTSE